MCKLYYLVGSYQKSSLIYKALIHEQNSGKNDSEGLLDSADKQYAEFAWDLFITLNFIISTQLTKSQQQ